MLKNIPILIIFDINREDLHQSENKLRMVLNKSEGCVINYMNIDFQDGISTLYLGIEWLCEVMKPILLS
jgi:hypothetical protein